METVRVTREELYEQVWSEPMRVLAVRYGISDVALAKRCKRFRIPVPGRGYWAKKSAGQHVRATPLPGLPVSALPHDYVATFYLGQPKTDTPGTPEIIQRQIDFESEVVNLIVVRASLRSPHPLVRRTADVLREITGKSGQPLYSYDEPRLDVQVSRRSLQRALLIMDALVKAFERREWKVSAWTRGSSGDRKSHVTVLGQPVAFGIREKLKKVSYQENPQPATGSQEERHQDVLSGKLALVLRNRWGTSILQSWEDTDSSRVEDSLNDFAVAVVERAYDDILWDAGREDSEREREAAAARRESEKRKEETRLARIAKLERHAADFRKSQAVADFVSAVRTAGLNAPLTDLERKSFVEWLSWADAHAASLNPLTRPIRELFAFQSTISID